MIDDRSIQRALAAAGHDAGPIDGLWGPCSIAAARAFVAARGIGASWPDARRKIAVQQTMMAEAGIETGAIDGLIGPRTLHALELWQNRMRDIDAPPAEIAHQPTVWPRQRDVPAFFGPVGERQRLLDLPYAMKLAWNPNAALTRVSIHEKVHASAARAFAGVLAHYGADRIAALGLDRFGGALNVRRMRGGSAWSMHAWGIAIDIDPAANQLRWGRDRARLARPDCAAFLDIWEGEGWISLGRERNFDWMHIQAARL